MSRTIYHLRINCSSRSQVEEVSRILQCATNRELGNTWCFEVEEPEKEYFDFINEFLDLLESKYNHLNSIEILKEDISFWVLHEYDEQCNLEFLPKHLKRLGDNEIGLCVSCWDSMDVD